jgi:hypothetical protein
VNDRPIKTSDAPNHSSEKESDMTTTGLDHIQDGQIHESVFNFVISSISFGPLTITYTLDLSIPQVTFTLTLAGINIGGGTINPQNPCVTIGGGAVGFKAEATLCVVPANKQITYNVQVCVPFLGCKTYQGILYSW